MVKEPLVHFMLIGAGLFGAHAMLRQRGGDATGVRRIEVSSGEIERLRLTWARQWQRPPTREELSGLIEAHIREEVLYREALALGLDRDDTIVRRRMAQKFEFLAEDLATARDPTETELGSFFERERERYHVPALVSFSQIYFNSDRRGTGAEREAEEALVLLRGAGLDKAPSELGDPFLLDYEFRQTTVGEIGQIFGREFAEAIANVPLGTWQGPLASSYGWHLVKVDERTASRAPELAEVRDQVQQDWRDEQRRSANDDIYRRLRAGY